MLEDGSLAHYWLLRHFKSERDVNDMKNILQGLTGGFLKDSAIQTDLRYTILAWWFSTLISAIFREIRKKNFKPPNMKRGRDD